MINPQSTISLVTLRSSSFTQNCTAPFHLIRTLWFTWVPKKRALRTPKLNNVFSFSGGNTQPFLLRSSSTGCQNSARSPYQVLPPLRWHGVNCPISPAPTLHGKTRNILTVGQHHPHQSKICIPFIPCHVLSLRVQRSHYPLSSFRNPRRAQMFHLRFSLGKVRLRGMCTPQRRTPTFPQEMKAFLRAYGPSTTTVHKIVAKIIFRLVLFPRFFGPVDYGSRAKIRQWTACRNILLIRQNQPETTKQMYSLPWFTAWKTTTCVLLVGEISPIGYKFLLAQSFMLGWFTFWVVTLPFNLIQYVWAKAHIVLQHKPNVETPINLNKPGVRHQISTCPKFVVTIFGSKTKGFKWWPFPHCRFGL